MNEITILPNNFIIDNYDQLVDKILAKIQSYTSYENTENTENIRQKSKQLMKELYTIIFNYENVDYETMKVRKQSSYDLINEKINNYIAETKQIFAIDISFTEIFLYYEFAGLVRDSILTSMFKNIS